MVTNDYVQLPADGAGKKLQTQKQTVGAHDVHIEAVCVTDGAGNIIDPRGVVVTTGDQITVFGNTVKDASGTAYTFLMDADGHVQIDVLNLAQLEDAVHGSGDIGIMPLGVRQDSIGAMAADGDYHPLQVNRHGIQRVDSQRHFHIDECNVTTGWSILNDETENLASTTNHVWNTAAIEFDKVAGDTVLAGIQKTLASFSLDPFDEGSGFLIWSLYLSSIADVDYAFIRLGTDNANYNEWRIDDDVDALGVGWNSIRASLFASDATGLVGNGMDSSAITYCCIGVAFDANANTLADIAVDHISVTSGRHTSADIQAMISSSVSSPNVIVRAWGNAVDTNDGNSGNNTLRVVLATDQPELTNRTKTTREDTTLYSEDVAAGGAGDTEIVAASVGEKIKVFAAGYESDADVVHQFRFAVGTKKFGRRITAGIYCQTFVEPLVSAANEALNFRAEGAVNAKVWVQYVQE